MDKNNNLDGRWKNASFTVVIKGDKYVSLFNGLRYGKGTIVYDNENFTLTSTHAHRFLFFWTPFIEIVKGKYIITNDDEIVISDIKDRYTMLNGIWIHDKEIN